MDNEESTPIIDYKTNDAGEWKIKVYKILYNFFLVWGSIGLILFSLSVAGVETENILLNIGGFLVYVFGPKISTVAAIVFMSLSFWWFWLLLGYGMKRARKYRGIRSFSLIKKR